ncbi:MAG TPA: hypothetical protein VK977_07005 [Actinomycetota bacterium]|nr:hypothetical protein [Actinomycetota bacterium]
MRRGPLLLALFLIGLGIILLLRNVGALPEDVSLWGPVLMAIGAWLVIVRLTFPWGEQGGFVFPAVLIGWGGGLLLHELGAIDEETSIWPIVVIAAGVGFLLEALPIRQPPPEPEDLSIPLEGVRAAQLTIHHGAGRLWIEATDRPGVAVEARVPGGVEREVHRSGDRLEVSLRQTWRGGWGRVPLEWRVGVTVAVPVSLRLRTGAGETNADLSALRVPQLSVQTGASKASLILPARGRTSARIEAGAASVDIRVPDTVAARIRVRAGLAGVDVDPGRFRRMDGVYESNGFEQAKDRVELDLEGGAASFRVR